MAEEKFSGRIQVTPTTFNVQTGAINGGYSFDLPLATVAAFQNQALQHQNANSQNARGFLGGVLNQSQANFNQGAEKAFAYGEKNLQAITKMHQQTMNVAYKMAKRGGIGGCYITTAICQADDKPDNCDELETLRAFRDGWMKGQPGGVELIREYYDTAPAIVRAIKRGRNPNEVFAFLRDQFLGLAVAQIKVGDNAGALNTYKRMVATAKAIVGGAE